MDKLRAWVDLRRRDIEPKSVLGQALGYLDRQRPSRAPEPYAAALPADFRAHCSL